MPFQSEKQRRYLWANEPKIARDWADTYGSRIEKNDGGISQLVKPGPGRPGYRGSPHDDSATGSGTSSGGNYGGSKNFSNRDSHHPGVGPIKPKVKIDTTKDIPEQTIKAQKKAVKDRNYKIKAQKLQNKKKQAFVNHLKETWNANPHMDAEEVADMLESQFGVTTNPDGTKSYNFDGDAIDTGFQTGTKYNMPTNTQLGPFGLKDKGATGKKLGTNYMDSTPDFQTLESMPTALKALGFGKPNYNTLVSTFNRMNTLNDINTKEGWQGYWDDARKRNNSPDRGNQALPYYYAPRDVHPGTGDDTTTEPEYSFNTDFQDSLTSAATTPNYYAGENPLASNLAWGKQMGADPRTMGRTSWAADGGRIPRAFGGIMDSSTGRRGYFLGSIGKVFGKVAKAAKKVFKSPIGKAAIIAAGGYYLGGGNLMGLQRSGMTGFSMANLKAAPFVKQLLTKKGLGDAWSWGKLGILGATALPWMMPGPEEDEGDNGSNYDVLKNKYASQLMNIKRGVNAGSLDPNKFSYLPSDYVYTGAKGGRAGYYAGGQSIPSPYTIEDARKSSMQDKMGGITDVMKRADLSRQGDVGQMYMAQGGRIGYAHGGAGYPPVTMGQVPQAPPQMPTPPAPPSPMPAPQPNRMAGMNPMMGGMNPMMGGRRMAQEGGLMDLGGMEKDYRNDGGFVPLGGEEKADDVPARLSKNEFVFTADAVRGAGGGDIDKGAEIMENVMTNLEQGGQISEETQGLGGAQEMFGVSERLGEVI
jgi:hypothetical protein